MLTKKFKKHNLKNAKSSVSCVFPFLKFCPKLSCLIHPLLRERVSKLLSIGCQCRSDRSIGSLFIHFDWEKKSSKLWRNKREKEDQKKCKRFPSSIIHCHQLLLICLAQLFFFLKTFSVIKLSKDTKSVAPKVKNFL